MDIFLLWDVFFNNDQDDYEDDWEIVHLREPHLKINNFFENIVLHYSLTGKNKAKFYLCIIYFLHTFIIIYNCI